MSLEKHVEEFDEDGDPQDGSHRANLGEFVDVFVVVEELVGRVEENDCFDNGREEAFVKEGDWAEVED